MTQLRFDFDLRLVTPQGKTVRFPSELLCMTREHHADFLRRRYGRNQATLHFMYGIAPHIQKYHRLTGRYPA